MQVCDIINRRFSRLVVVSRDGSVDGKATWRVMCDCGREVVVDGDKLRRGHTRSCGCLKLERMSDLGKRNATHGHARHEDGRSPTYVSWLAMGQRCNNSGSSDWGRYGGRGISVCDRWKTFEVFLADMGERPFGKTLDRLNVNGNYEPANCRWATASEQVLNRRPRNERALWTDERRRKHSEIMKKAASKKTQGK